MVNTDYQRHLPSDASRGTSHMGRNRTPQARRHANSRTNVSRMCKRAQQLAEQMAGVETPPVDTQKMGVWTVHSSPRRRLTVMWGTQTTALKSVAVLGVHSSTTRSAPWTAVGMITAVNSSEAWLCTLCLFSRSTCCQRSWTALQPDFDDMMTQTLEGTAPADCRFT